MLAASTVPIAASFLVRLGLVSLFFPASALDKTLNFRGACAQAQSVFKPAGLARLTIFAGLAIEIAGPLAILSGRGDRLAGAILCGYCVVTAVLFKRFWMSKDLFAAGQSGGRDLFWDFMKNFSLGSGFLLLALGPTGDGLALLLADPFASTHPYGG